MVSVSPTSNNIVYKELAQLPTELSRDLCPNGNCEIRVGPPADYPKLNPKRGGSLSVKADWQPDLGRPANLDLQPTKVTSDINIKTTVNILDNTRTVDFNPPNSPWGITYTEAPVPLGSLDPNPPTFNPITKFNASDGNININFDNGTLNGSIPLSLLGNQASFVFNGQNLNGFQAGLNVPIKLGEDVDIALNLNTSTSPVNIVGSAKIRDFKLPIIGGISKVRYNSATGGVTFGFATPPPSSAQNNGSSVEADKNTGISIFGGSVTTEFRGFNDARFGITWPK
jgi:hypothetical protein